MATRTPTRRCRIPNMERHLFARWAPRNRGVIRERLQVIVLVSVHLIVVSIELVPGDDQLVRLGIVIVRGHAEDVPTLHAGGHDRDVLAVVVHVARDGGHLAAPGRFARHAAPSGRPAVWGRRSAVSPRRHPAVGDRPAGAAATAPATATLRIAPCTCRGAAHSAGAASCYGGAGGGRAVVLVVVPEPVDPVVVVSPVSPPEPDVVPLVVADELEPVLLPRARRERAAPLIRVGCRTSDERQSRKGSANRDREYGSGTRHGKLLMLSNGRSRPTCGRAMQRGQRGLRTTTIDDRARPKLVVFAPFERPPRRLPSPKLPAFHGMLGTFCLGLRGLPPVQRGSTCDRELGKKRASYRRSAIANHFKPTPPSALEP